jgi:diphosphomevalonate decarboxylase
VNNTTLSNVQKFHYLIASLNNEAKDLIANLHVTNENFLVAWQLVIQRYNNNRLIAMMLAKYLCQMPQVKKGDASALRHLINHVSSHMNALKALSLNVTFQDLMLNHLMLASLDSETHQQWEQLTAACTDVPTTSELITFLESRCRALELIHNTQSTNTATVSPRVQQSARTKVSRSAYCNIVTPTQCILCSESHRLFKCDKFLSMQPRRHNYVKEQRLCSMF